MAGITNSIRLTYENLKKYGAKPILVFVPASLAGNARRAVKELGWPVDIIEVRPLAKGEKSRRCTYKANRPYHAKRNK